MNNQFLEETAQSFGFYCADDMILWANTMQPDQLISKENGNALYTDGDSGLALVSMSEVFDDEGISIQLICCNYCDFDFDVLSGIVYELQEIWKQYTEEDE